MDLNKNLKTNEIYPCFADNKIKITKLYFVKIIDILKFKKLPIKIKSIITSIQNNPSSNIIKTEDPIILKGISCETEELTDCYFIRNNKKQWIGIGEGFGTGVLDLYGDLLDELLDPEYIKNSSLTEEEIITYINKSRDFAEKTLNKKQ